MTNVESFPKPGSQLHGFTLRRTQHVPELELTAVHLQHDKTGAEYLHVARDDANNVFSIGFKTNPPDATGVPHILEHTTLCGSERYTLSATIQRLTWLTIQRYPVRDPFFKMLPRSLSNFMNAFTSSDHTTYPFATTNVQDFRNLMSVYLDATLHPLLKANDFYQEGWRIGPENPRASQEAGKEGEQTSPLVFKGVVYNEMKGQMSDAGYLYYIRFHEHLIPALNNSGGDPQKITDLTHEQLTRFHHDHYHPSSAKIFTYGNMPLEEHLREVNNRLERFDKIPADLDIKTPIDFSSGAKAITVQGPVDPLVPQDAQYKTSTTWIMGDTTDMVERFSLSVISSLLIDGYGSPLYQGLIEAGLGADYSPNTGFSPTGTKSVLSIGLTGVKEENVPLVREKLFEIFRDVRQKGFSKIKLDGILHQLELSLKHKTAHFGMGLMQRIEGDWFNGVDPFDALAWQKTLDGFKERCQNPDYLQGLVEKYLLSENTLTFTMTPAPSYSQDLATEETERLASKIAEATSHFSSKEEAYKHLADRELELLEAQESAAHQDLSCLPSVHVRDIHRQKERKEVRKAEVDGAKVQWRETNTNGLTYFRALNMLDELPDDLRELMPLFSDSIMRLGTRNTSMEKLEELIKLKTGGISVGFHSSTSPHDIMKVEQGLLLTGHAFDRNIPDMYELLRTLIAETDFDSPEAEKKILQLLQTSANGAVDSIAESGHAYARRYAMSGLTPEGRLNEQISGLTQVKLTTSLAGHSEPGQLRGVIEKLKAIQAIASSNGGRMRVAINCGSESASSNEKMLQNFLSTLPAKAMQKAASSSSPKLSRNAKSFFPLPFQVYYSAMAVSTIPYTNPAGAPLQILSQLLTHKHLHHEIREKGGAYGGGAYASGLGGTFGYYSYRDPNPQNTLKIMQNAGAWARDRQWTAQDLEEAKLSVFQGLDAPQSVNQEGMTEFLSGVDHEMQQTRREQLLDVTAEQVKDVAQKFLVEPIESGRVHTAVLGAKQDFFTEEKGWSVKEMGMTAAPEAETATGDEPMVASG